MEALIERLGNADSFSSSQEAEDAEKFSQELIALQSIYGEDHLKLAEGPPNDCDRLSLLLHIHLQIGDEEVGFQLHIFLPHGYPATKKPPQLMLGDRYIGRLKVTNTLELFVNSIFQEGNASGIVWQEYEPMLFEGIDAVTSHVKDWYEAKVVEQSKNAGALGNKTEKSSNEETPGTNHQLQVDFSSLIRSEPIIDRKSEFLGHAIRINHPDEVPIILSHIQDSDKRIQRATHPSINAWVCRTKDGVLHHGKCIPDTDCDDDGETAAGGRLAHLLSLLVRIHLTPGIKKCISCGHALVRRRSAWPRPV